MLTKKGKRLVFALAAAMLALIALLVILIVIIAGNNSVKKQYIYYDEKTNSLAVSAEIITLENNTVKFSSDETLLEYYFEYDTRKKIGEYDFGVESDLISRVRADKQCGVIVVSAQMPLVFDAVLNSSLDTVFIKMGSPEERYDKIVLLDAGHGGDDAGAVVNGISEKDINIAVVEKVNELIKNSGSGIKAYLIRSGDETLHLTKRPFIGNSFADMYVSVHCNTFENSSQPHGTTTHYNGYAELLTGRCNVTNEEFAAIMQRNVSEALQSRDRGIMGDDNFFVLVNSTMPAVLIELGYMTNPEEFELLQDDSYQNLAAQGIYKGIVEAFGK